MSCDQKCFHAIVSECRDIIITGFPPNYPLYFTVQKSGKLSIHSRQTSSDNTGQLTIQKANLPTGYLVRGDRLLIDVRSTENFNQRLFFTFGEKQYECIQAELVNFETGDDTYPVNVISGDVTTEAPAGPGTQYLIPIDSSEFINGNTYINPALEGKVLAIFWDDVPRFLTSAEFQPTTAEAEDPGGDVTGYGIKITVPDFGTATQHLHIWIIGNEN